MSYDDEDIDGDFGILVICIFLVVLGGAFLYKVWNERQMTHEYARQADALERIAVAGERDTNYWSALAVKRSAAWSQLPTLGGTAVER